MTTQASTRLTEAQRKMLEAPNFAHLATMGEDGFPQVSAVWVDVKDGAILINTAEGRVKTRNLRSNPMVGISVVDQNDPYANVTIKGRVDEITTDGADEHIDLLAKKYLGKDTYPYRSESEKRVIVRVLPEHVAGYGV